MKKLFLVIYFFSFWQLCLAQENAHESIQEWGVFSDARYISSRTPSLEGGIFYQCNLVEVGAGVGQIFDFNATQGSSFNLPGGGVHFNISVLSINEGNKIKLGLHDNFYLKNSIPGVIPIGNYLQKVNVNTAGISVLYELTLFKSKFSLRLGPSIILFHQNDYYVNETPSSFNSIIFSAVIGLKWVLLD